MPRRGAEVAIVPPRLWRLATADRVPSAEPRLPAPETIRADTVAELRRLAEQTADTLAAIVRPDHPRQVYPTNPLGLRTNTRAVAAGTAGVLHALRRAGRPVDPAVVRRLRDDSLAAVDTTAPGLLFGTAGIACVLADLGEPEAANTLLDAAADHPLNAASATLGGGIAGTAIGLLAAYCRHGEQRRLDTAARLLDGIPDGDAIEAVLSTEYPSGLVGGRPGVALALYYLGRITGDAAALTRGLRLLRDDWSTGCSPPYTRCPSASPQTTGGSCRTCPSAAPVMSRCFPVTSHTTPTTTSTARPRSPPTVAPSRTPSSAWLRYRLAACRHARPGSPLCPACSPAWQASQ